MLINPVTDSDFGRESYHSNGEGYLLTTALMTWFWDHYADPEDRTDPRASPLRATDLSGLPPALVVTCEFDPLADEGAAYADALADAGVETRHLACAGLVHTSITAVGMIQTAADARVEIATALRQMLGVRVLA